MNRAIRLLVMSGLDLAITLAIGVVPAQAVAGHGATVEARSDWNNNSDVVRYLRTRTGCESVGRLGELRVRRDHYDCSPMLFGFNRGAWVPEVAAGDWIGGWDNDDWYDGCNIDWNDGDFQGGWD
jgi:hypothetical protein